MFSKAKRFEPVGSKPTASKKLDVQKSVTKVPSASNSKPLVPSASKLNTDTQSQCSSTHSVKSFVTPRPLKQAPVIKTSSSLKKIYPSNKSVNKQSDQKIQNDIIKAYEVEIRNKDHTISECNKQIEDLRTEFANLQKIIQGSMKNSIELDHLDKRFCQITLTEEIGKSRNMRSEYKALDETNEELKHKIFELERQCDKLEQEVSSKQVELTSLEDIIVIRDSLCEDLQTKLTDVESCLEETQQRLEMVKGHHALALEANESIRREYKAELETLKTKLDEEKQVIINKSKTDLENIKIKYKMMIESIKNELLKEKDVKIHDLQQELTSKDQEMKAKLEQINEATHEKIRLCEIQFEERSRNMQEHLSQQQKRILCLENEAKELRCTLGMMEEKNTCLQKDIKKLKIECDLLNTEKSNLIKELDDIKEESKKKKIDFENEINKLTVEVDKVTKEKNKFEMSLSVTRDIVQVLTMRLRESDNELEHLESKVQTLTNSKEVVEAELATYKNSFNNTVLECNEYKEALVNILKSKAALAKEHTRIMEHNVSLIESLQNVEKEAYRELGSIKNELIEDVELLKKESNSQIKMLRDEVEKKRMLCELATEHAGQATVAAEQSRALLAQAAAEISRLEADNHCLHQQIQDQQSLVVELSLLRQENEELTMAIAKQSSLMDKMKKDVDQSKPKSPSVIRKSHKLGKENLHAVVSPLRERNH